MLLTINCQDLGVWCRPFSQYWAVPPNNGTYLTRAYRLTNRLLTYTPVQCSAATNHLITNAVFNISSDLMIILIPMPIFIQSTLTLRRKLILCGVFAVGTFTVCASLRKSPSPVDSSLTLPRSFPQSSTNFTASPSPSASTGPSGTSANHRPPSSPRTFP